MKEKIDKVKQGKQSRARGLLFESSVRKDLEKNWIVAKWTNNVEFREMIEQEDTGKTFIDKENGRTEYWGKLVKVKNKWAGPGRPMMLGAGFPDFIAFKEVDISGLATYDGESIDDKYVYEVIGVESKMNGKLDKEEKEKCEWLLDNNVFSKILIASKSKEKRGAIIYKEWEVKNVKNKWSGRIANKRV